MKGRADGELSAAKTMYNAAASGDARAALDILKHNHGWVAKQQIDVNIDQQISITAALEKAQSRVIEGLYTEVRNMETIDAYAVDAGRTGSVGLPPPESGNGDVSEERGRLADHV